MTYTPLNEPPRRLAPRSPATVEVYASARPPRPGVEVGLIEIEQQSPASGGTPEMVDKVRRRAAEIGCDAVLLSEPTDRVQSYSGSSMGQVQRGTGMYMGTHTARPNYVRSHRATCFVYTDANAPQAVEGDTVINL